MACSPGGKPFTSRAISTPPPFAVMAAVPTADALRVLELDARGCLSEHHRARGYRCCKHGRHSSTKVHISPSTRAPRWASTVHTRSLDEMIL
jgi:hypothetical protein